MIFEQFVWSLSPGEFLGYFLAIAVIEGALILWMFNSAGK